jgi:hypothetical protein
LSSNTFLKKQQPKAEVSPSVNIPQHQSSTQKTPLKIENPSPPPINFQPTVVQKQVTQPKKGLFDEDDDDDGFLTKKPAQKPISQTPVPQKSPNPIAVQPKKDPIAQPASTQSKKKNLFDDSGSDDSFSAEQERKKR